VLYNKRDFQNNNNQHKIQLEILSPLHEQIFDEIQDDSCADFSRSLILFITYLLSYLIT
jgi:hypothetical protein